MEKIVIISGGASGLGFELAKKIVQMNLNVAILGRNRSKLEEASKILNSTHPNSTISFECSIDKEDDVEKVYKTLNENYEITHLFNNAGIGRFGPPEETTQVLVDEVFAGNLKGMILLTTYLLKNTKKEKGAVIVNIMSTAALVGRAAESIYCAAKWGARGYTEALKVYAKGSNYKVVAVYPGGMKTAFWKNSGFDMEVSKFMNPEEVASKIVHACFSIDSSFITDITISRP